MDQLSFTIQTKFQKRRNIMIVTKGVKNGWTTIGGMHTPENDVEGIGEDGRSDVCLSLRLEKFKDG